MTDIVERLRKLVILDEVGSDNPLAREAADEIERLKDLLGKANALCRIRAERIKELETERDELVEFVNEVRRTGDTRIASMAIAALAKLGADKTGEVEE